MNILGVCIGVGDAWGDAAALACSQMRKHTGVECVVCDDIPCLPQGACPSWGKAWLWDLVPNKYDRLLVFDADLVCIRPWNQWELPHRFMACRELFVHHSYRNEQTLYNVPRYFNAGLLVMDRSTAARMDDVKSYAPRYGSWYEQTAMNRVFTDWSQLPSQLNWFCREETSGMTGALDAGAINVHLAGRKDTKELLKMMLKVVEVSNG